MKMPTVQIEINDQNQKRLVGIFLDLKNQLWNDHNHELTWEKFLEATLAMVVQDFVDYVHLIDMLMVLVLTEEE